MPDDRQENALDQSAEQAATEGVAADNMNAAADALPPEATEKRAADKPRRKRRLGPWLLLLLIFVGLPATWLLMPPQLQQQAMQLLNKLNPQPAKQIPVSTEPAPQAEPAAAGEPASEPAAKGEAATGMQTETASEEQSGTVAADTTPVSEAQPATAAAPTTNEPQPSVDHSAALQDEIRRLQAELDSMRSERGVLTQRLHAQQTDGMRVRLSLLASPDTRLAQRSTLWTELAALPTLDTAEQEKAHKMASLLDADSKQLAAWRQSLARLAQRIPDVQQADILPKPKNPYFASLLGGFHLRPAPSNNEQQQAGLRARLLEMQHALGLEDWPEPRAWRQLLEALGDQFGDKAGFGLPESLGGITADIDASRTVAADWLEAL